MPSATPAPQVEEYLAAAPEPQRSTLRAMIAMLCELLPGADLVVSYGVPTLKVGGVALAGVGFSAGHCSYFPMSGSVTTSMADQLVDYRTSKGAVRFATDAPLPRPLVAALVDARRAEIAAGT